MRERCGVRPASAGPAVWRCRVTRCEQSRQRNGWSGRMAGGWFRLFQGGDITAHPCGTRTILQMDPAERGAAIQAVRDQSLDESNTLSVSLQPRCTWKIPKCALIRPTLRTLSSPASSSPLRCM